VEAFDRMKKIIAETEEDVRKAEGGNKTAVTRVRKAMQDIKAAAQEVREKALELREAAEESKPSA
jgi:Histone H1-like protein Hc1